MAEHEEILTAWEAADRPEILHPMVGVSIRQLDLWLDYNRKEKPQAEYQAEVARIRRHLGLDT